MIRKKDEAIIEKCGVIVGFVTMMLVLRNRKKRKEKVQKNSNIVSYDRFVEKKIEDLIREVENNG